MRVAIIGVGFVGSAVAASVPQDKLCTFDKLRPERTRNWDWDHVSSTDLCFICTPTPTFNGEQDLSSVVDACKTISGLTADGYKGVVAVKSTVLPGSMNRLAEMFPDLRLVHNPEFLRERTAVKDYLEQKVILLSGKTDDVRVVRKYADIYLNVTHAHCSPTYEATEWAKYAHNCTLPVILSFLNEIYDMIGDKTIYDEAVDMAQWFGNVGSLTKVPGPDGMRGWGGSCFLKDTKALETFALSKGFRMRTLEGAINTNTLVRGEND